MDSELQKLAAVAIRQLQTENEELKEKLFIYEEAEKLAFEFLHSNAITVEDLESTIKDFSTKSLNELEVLRKAQEFNKTASTLSLFKLSSGADYADKLDPITRMLLEDI